MRWRNGGDSLPRDKHWLRRTPLSSSVSRGCWTMSAPTRVAAMIETPARGRIGGNEKTFRTTSLDCRLMPSTIINDNLPRCNELYAQPMKNSEALMRSQPHSRGQFIRMLRAFETRKMEDTDVGTVINQDVGLLAQANVCYKRSRKYAINDITPCFTRKILKCAPSSSPSSSEP